MILGLLACAAVHPIPDSHPATLAGRFEVSVPDEWTVARNVRGPLGQHLSLHDPSGASSITIDLVREDRGSRELPLSLVVDTYAVELGRGRGISSEHLAQDVLVVADRTAFATTVRRRVGPHERLASTVGLRGDDHLAVLTLHTVDDAPASVTLAWDLVLESFQLPLDPPPDVPPFLDDVRDLERIETGLLE